MYIIIIGGGRLGTFLAKRLLAEKHTVVIIEKEQEVAQDIARDLNVVMIHGDGCDPKILEQAGIDRAAVIAAVTGKDEDNFIVCQIAKDKYKVNRTVARVNDPENER